MNVNLYQTYLIQDMLAKRLEKIGCKATWFMTSRHYGNKGFPYEVSTSVDSVEGYFGPEQREEKVNLFLDHFPDTDIERSKAFDGQPLMKLSGNHAGIYWELDFGVGVCERVQVGSTTKTRPVIDENTQYEEYQEPVYEYRCPDPILQ